MIALLIDTIKSFLTASGLSLESARGVSFFLSHPRISNIFRLKISPLAISHFKNHPGKFSQTASFISIGPAYKSTSYGRHELSDSKIIYYVKNKNIFSLADIGVSDGSSALPLFKKLRNQPVSYHLYDKYNFLFYSKSLFGYRFFNESGQIVYIKFLHFLFFLYPFHLFINRSSGNTVGKISFSNPQLEKYNLKLEYFDVFETKLNLKFDLIKCANLLTLHYFTPNENVIGLKNLLAHLNNEGLLFLIHNEEKKEKLIILQKKGDKFAILENHWYEEYARMLEQYNLI